MCQMGKTWQGESVYRREPGKEQISAGRNLARTICLQERTWQGELSVEWSTRWGELSVETASACEAGVTHSLQLLPSPILPEVGYLLESYLWVKCFEMMLKMIMNYIFRLDCILWHINPFWVNAESWFCIYDLRGNSL